MRRSFGRSGGGGGGGGMLRTVGRAFRAGLGEAQDPFSASSSTSSTTTPTRSTYRSTSAKNLSVSSSSSSTSSFNLPISATSTLPAWPPCSSSASSTSSHCDDFEWVSAEENDGERANAFFDDESVFGSVPSKDEVENAVFALQRVMEPASYSQFIKDRYGYNSDKEAVDQNSSPINRLRRVSSVGSELDWIEPSMQLCNPRTIWPQGSTRDRVYDAFHLLQNDPYVQRMVVSLSSDEAVWDAVLKNKVVRELRESLQAVEGNILQSSDKSPDKSACAATVILKWIVDSAKAKVMEIIEKISKLVNELFQTVESEKDAGEFESFDEKLRSSFMLSVMVLLVVVVTRSYGA